MNRSVVGIACGVMIGLVVGWYARPSTATLFTSRVGTQTSADPGVRSDQRRFSNTRSALKQALAQLAINPDQQSHINGMPVVLELVQTMAWAAPIETARMTLDSRLNEGVQTDVLFAIARTWFSRDGAAILQTLANENDYDKLKPFYYPVFAIVANELPFEALDPIMALEDHQLSRYLFTNLASSVPAEEVPRLAQVLMGLPVGERQWIIRNTARDLAGKNPEFALTWAAALTSGEAVELRNSALRALAQTEPMRAFALADGAGPNREAVELTALEALARTDPQGAIAMYERVDDSNVKQTLASYVARGWGESDPAAAAQWVSSLGGDQSETLQILARHWAAQDIDAAAAFTNKLNEGDRNTWVNEVAQSFMYEDPERYLQWIDQFRAEPYYGQLLTRAVWPSERTNPEAAVSFVLGLDPSVRSAPLQSLIDQFAEHDPKRAAGWLSQIPDEDIRLASTDSLIQKWNSQSPEDVTQWIDGLPAGTFKDAALAAMVAHTGVSDLKSLSDRIANPDTRIAALFNRGVRPEVTREIVAILHEIGLDDRQWKALEGALARTSP